ncbi:MAG: VOC family protein [Myxococcales bacterium]
MAKAKRAVPQGYYTVTPSLVLDDTTAAIEWYKKTFGADELSRAVGPDGKVMHAEIRIGNSRVMLNDAMMGAKSPKAYGGSPASLWLYVDDCDVLFNRAVAAGAEVSMPVADMFWGDRFGAVVDPFGHRWSLATRKEDLTPDEQDQRQREWMKKFGKPDAPAGG